jgi:DNA-binding LytR/AlgR family response regulator
MKTYQQKGNNALLTLNHKTSSKVLINSVILIKGDINYTKFYLECGKVKTVSHSIKFFEPHLETHGFLRVHRSFMINPNYVKNYDSHQEILTMSNGEIANISRRRKGILKDFVSYATHNKS